MSFASSKSPTIAEQKLRGALASQKPIGFFKRVFSRGVTSIMREKRETCCVVGVLVLIDKSIPLDGMVMEIASDGAIFRSASSYIMDRTGSEILLRFAEREFRGRIAASTVRGYDVLFQQPVPGETVKEILRSFGASSVTHSDTPLANSPAAQQYGAA